MVNAQNREEKKLGMLKTILKVFAAKGLENTSMRNLSAELKINISSLYEYFNSKEELVISCAKYYMEKLDRKFEREYKKIPPDLKTEVKLIFDMIVKEKANLRFIYQVISSPMYGTRGRDELEPIYTNYLRFSDKLADSYGIARERFEEAFLLFIATVHDFCLWDNRGFVEKKLNCIYYLIDKELENK